MLSILLMATVVGGFPYQMVTLSDRAKPAIPAPAASNAAWREHVETVVATSPKDAAFSRFFRHQVLRLQRAYYNGEGVEESRSFATKEGEGNVDVGAEVVAASPDIVSVMIGTSFYESPMPHPNTEGVARIVWSRRLHRPLAETDVFAIPPDRALRRLALARFDNNEALQAEDWADGLPLAWDHASIGPDGITWSFGSYELGGYLSAGAATVGWTALKPYLRRQLPFVIAAIRAAPPRR